MDFEKIKKEDFDLIEELENSVDEESKNNVQQYNDRVAGKIDLFKLRIRRRNKITLISYAAIFLTFFFKKYRDFDVAFNSTLFIVLLIISALFVAYNYYFLRKDYSNIKLKYQYSKTKTVHDIFEVVNIIPVFIAIVALVNTFALFPASVIKTSMEPNFSEGDRILVYHFFEDYDRFDVIIAKVTEEDYYLKRVIGLPGEKVTIKEGHIFINDVIIVDTTPKYESSETYCEAGASADPLAECSWVVPDGEYFLLGDNREASIDSRVFETIKREDLYGKVIIKLDIFK